MKREFLEEKVFSSIEEAQKDLDGWVEEYNTTREHQSLGDRPPIERFRFALKEPFEEVGEEEAKALSSPTPRLMRRVGTDGKVSLLNFKYHVGRYLGGQSVELVLKDGLIEIFHHEVLVATHARRHLPEQDDDAMRHALAAPPRRPATDSVVVRKVDTNGTVSFAGANYRVGNAYKRRQVEVSLASDTVQIWVGGSLLRTHSVRHEKGKEHGAFANPGGHPRRVNAA